MVLQSQTSHTWQRDVGLLFTVYYYFFENGDTYFKRTFAESLDYLLLLQYVFCFSLYCFMVLQSQTSHVHTSRN